MLLGTLITLAQVLYPLTPILGPPTFVDENEVEAFKKENSNWTPEVMEEELLFNYYYPQECGCWGDGFYNCVFHNETTTSFLASNNNYTYESGNLTDLDLRTAWVEGVDGNGIGESITFKVETIEAADIQIQELVIVNGYVKNRALWKANSRVKKFKLYIDGTPKAILNLRDVDNYQKFNVQRFVNGLTKFELKLEIMEVIEGDKYADTAISEIFFKGTGCM